MKATHDIDALISKFLAGEASPEEAMLLEDWKAELPENQRYFDQSLAVFGLVQLTVSTDAAWTNVEPQLQQAPIRRLQTPGWFRIAAAIAVLVAVGSLAWYFFPAKTEQLYTAQATTHRIRLQDGTAVAIAPHSSLELAPGYGASNRTLKLKGSGYFSVKHSAQLPFIIDAGALHIKDLGTQFNVEANDDTIFVRVDEGVVLIYDNAGMQITLKASQSAHYVIATGKMELEVETSPVPAAAKTFVFDNQRLEEVVNRLQKVYNADIRIETPEVKNCLITTQFSNESLDLVLSVVAETLGLTVEKTGTVYWLKGTSCTH